MKKLLVVAMLVVAMVCLFAISASAAEYVDEVGIKYVTISDTAAKVADSRSTFSGTEAIIAEKVTIGGKEYTVTTIGSNAFNGITSLETIYFPPTITEIQGYTYCGCSNMKNVYITVENLVALGSQGLTTCTNSNSDSGTIKTIKYYPSSEYGKAEPQTIVTADFKNIKTIGSAAAQGFNAKNLILGENLESMSKQVFRHSSIETLTIESTKLTYFYHYSFDCCVNLKTIVINSAPTTIENNFFSSCTAVESITMDLSKCTSVSGTAFCFATKYDGGNTTAQWYNLEGKKIVDLSSMKNFYGKSFASSNIGSAEVIWPSEIEIIEDECFRKCNIQGVLYINMAAGKTATIKYYMIDGNNFTTAIFGNGVSTVEARFASDCTVVALADQISFTHTKNPPLTKTSTLYCKSANISHGTKPVIVPITSGTAVWSRTCGIYATVQTTAGQTVKVGTDTHNFEFVDYNNNYCPINVMGDFFCAKCKTTKQEIAVENYEGVTPVLGHDMSQLFDIVYANGVINAGNTTMKCADCDNKETTEGNANAIITFKGFSAKVGGPEIMVDYKIDKDAYNNYKSLYSNFGFGVAARVLSASGASDELVEIIGGVAQATAEKSIVADITTENCVGIMFKITGFSLDTHYNTPLAMCAFVTDGEEVDYICQNAEGVVGQYAVAYATTFNEQAIE